MLPYGTSILDSGSESWTDHIFEAELEFQPGKLSDYFTGRQFEKVTLARKPEQIQPQRISGHSGFSAVEVWSWTTPHSDASASGFAKCTVYRHASPNRLLVQFSSE